MKGAEARRYWQGRQRPAERHRRDGREIVAGVDEAGRGPLAGPVVAAAVILPFDAYLPGLRDSKLLTAESRETFFQEIRRTARGVAVGIASVAEIDRHNIRRAAFLAMRRAIAALPLLPEVVLVDGEAIPDLEIAQENIIGGDDLSNVIAAASVVAKVVRDRLMVALDERFPGYDLAVNKGYGTAAHREGLLQLGACPIHRRSFRLPGTNS